MPGNFRRIWQWKSMTVKAMLGLLDKNFQISGNAVFHGKIFCRCQRRTAPSAWKSYYHGITKSHDLLLILYIALEARWLKHFFAHTTWTTQEIHSAVSGNSGTDANPKWGRSFGKISSSAFWRYAPAYYDRHCHGAAAWNFDRR